MPPATWGSIRAPFDTSTLDAGSDSAGLDATKDVGDAGVDTAPDTPVMPPDCTVVDTEVCNGFDDDGDGHVDECLPCAGTLVISELSTRGPTGPESAFDEFVEIYNRSAGPVRLTGLSMAYRSATGLNFDTRATVSGMVILPAGGYFVMGSTEFTGTADLPNAWSLGFRDGGAHVRIAHTGLELDRVGWGDAVESECVLTAPGSCPAVPADAIAGGSYERKAKASSTASSMMSGGADELAGNAHDTNQNADDFITRTTRDPQTLSATAEPPTS